MNTLISNFYKKTSSSKITKKMTKNIINISKYNFAQVYQPKTKEDIVARVHKYNMNTITMGFPDLYGKFVGKKYDTDYFVEVKK